MGNAIAGTILKMITVTFGLLIALFILSYFPETAVGAFASSVLNAAGAILGAIPAIVGFVIDRITGG